MVQVEPRHPRHLRRNPGPAEGCDGATGGLPAPSLRCVPFWLHTGRAGLVDHVDINAGRSDARERHSSLDGRVSGVRSHFRRPERKDDAALGNSRGFEIAGDAGFRAVALDPALPIDQVDVDQAAMDALLVSTDTHQEVMIARPVEDELTLDFPVGIGVL